jgi:hypothetical protein
MIAPRIFHIPPCVSSSGQEAVELAAEAGIVLDDWQAYALANSLGETADGRWAAFEVGVCCPRQNGKSEIAVARMLAGLILFEEPLQVYSAHLFESAVEIHRRLASVLEENDDLSRRVKSIPRGNGRVGIELKNGCRVRFRARGSGGGRGLSPSCLLFDESMFLSAPMYADLVPAVSAQRAQQIWLLGSAADQAVHPDAVVFARMRERAMSGDAGALAWFEWSVPYDKGEVTEAIASDPAMIERANPATASGRLTMRQIALERDALDLQTFAVERGGAGDWPRGDGQQGVIDPEAWLSCYDAESEPDGPVVVAFDTAPHPLTGTAIAVCGRRADGLWHVEIVDICQDVAYAPRRIAELVAKHHPTAVVADKTGASSALFEALDQLRVDVTCTTASEHATAAQMFLNAVVTRGLRYRRPLHADQLDMAVQIAAKRSLGDGGFGWARKGSSASIAPLVACTLACWGAQTIEPGYDGPLLEVIA